MLCHLHIQSTRLTIQNETQPTKENILHFGNTTMLELGEFNTSKSVGVQHIDISESEFQTSHFDAFISRESPSQSAFH